MTAFSASIMARVLFLAPQPFFIERGTPIAVHLALKVLGARQDLQVDLLTYHEGANVALENVEHHRIKAPKWLRGVGPGLSVKKLICDFIFILFALKLAWRIRRDGYSLVHAVEESVFIALLLRLIFKIPYLYDMDSSLSGQIGEKSKFFRLLQPLLEPIEKCAVRNSVGVVPVCESLGELARAYGSKNISLLQDISLLKDNVHIPVSLRDELSLLRDSELVVYIGNLESYQGIDLLLESFYSIASAHLSSHLIVIGGIKSHIVYYQSCAAQRGLSARIHILGPRPLDDLTRYITQADILVSPRTKGENTPMKIYSYLHSGRSILATNLRTHTQVLDQEIAVLADPEPKAFGKALLKLLQDKLLRDRIGMNAKLRAEENYTFDVFAKKLNDTYDKLLGGS